MGPEDTLAKIISLRYQQKQIKKELDPLVAEVRDNIGDYVGVAEYDTRLSKGGEVTEYESLPSAKNLRALLTDAQFRPLVKHIEMKVRNPSLLVDAVPVADVVMLKAPGKVAKQATKTKTKRTAAKIVRKRKASR